MDMTKRELLHVEKNKKFDEICALLARELGYSELGTMSAAMRGYVEREAEYHVKQWEETVEFPCTPRDAPRSSEFSTSTISRSGSGRTRRGFSGASPRPSGISGPRAGGHQTLAMTGRYLNVQVSPFEL